MRRAALPAIGLLVGARVVAAEPWSITMESGAEADSNIARVETVDGSTPDDGAPQRIAAPAGRAGARLDYHDDLLGGFYGLRLSGLARMVATAKTKTENVMLYAGDWRWLREVGSQPVAVGLRLSAADAFSITGGTGARTFRSLGADAMLSLGQDERHLTIALGARDFWYKPPPAHMFDWRGPVANAQLGVSLWQTADKTRSLDLITTLGFEARTYTSHAVANCAPDMAVRPCSTETALHRRDRYQRAGIEVGWTGGVIATGSYQATVIDSNSFGQSLIRQRIKASVTMELPGKLLATTTATLQIDEYPDGVLLAKDLSQQEFTSLEDENRSSLQILLARKLSTTWSVEARGAAWRDFANTGDASFRRELVYVGIIYRR